MRQFWTFTAVVVVLTLCVLVAAIKRTPQPPSFCEACISQHNVTEWRAFGRWRVMKTETVSATPVSELLAQKHLCPEHTHVWSVTRFVSNPEPADAPPVLSLGLLNQPRVVNFLHDVFNYSDAESVNRWRELAGKVEYASSMDSALRFCRFPEEGFPDSAHFHVWWGESAFPLFNRLNEMTELD